MATDIMRAMNLSYIAMYVYHASNPWYYPIDVCDCNNNNDKQILCCHQRGSYCTLDDCHCTASCCADICTAVKKFCESPDLTIRMVIDRWNSKLPLDFARVTANMNISFRDLIRYNKLPFDKNILTMRSDIDTYYIELYHDTIKINWDLLPFNPVIPAKYFAENMKLPFNIASFIMRWDTTRQLIIDNEIDISKYTDISKIPTIECSDSMLYLDRL